MKFATRQVELFIIDLISNKIFWAAKIKKKIFLNHVNIDLPCVETFAAGGTGDDAVLRSLAPAFLRWLGEISSRPAILVRRAFSKRLRNPWLCSIEETGALSTRPCTSTMTASGRCSSVGTPVSALWTWRWKKSSTASLFPWPVTGRSPIFKRRSSNMISLEKQNRQDVNNSGSSWPIFSIGNWSNLLLILVVLNSFWEIYHFDSNTGNKTAAPSWPATAAADPFVF